MSDADRNTILASVQKGELTIEDAGVLLSGKPVKQLACKVSPKGAVMLTGPGLRRFGVILYANEWNTVLGFADNVRAFIAENKDKLSEKADKAA